MRRFQMMIGYAALACIVAATGLHAQQPGKYGHYEVYDADLFPREEYAARRAAVLGKLPDGSAMLLLAAENMNRLNDVDFQYRQLDDLLYLSGVTEDRSALLLLKDPITVGGVPAREILFVRRRDALKETWTGIVMGPDVAPRVTGIATVLGIDGLHALLDSVLPKLTTLYLDAPSHPGFTEPITGALISTDKDVRQRIAGKARALKIKSAGDIIDPMRMIKSPAETAMMRRAIDVSVQAHRETITGARPGMTEFQLQAMMEGAFTRQGSEYPGYPSIVGSGNNACVLHYTANRRPFKSGELVLMDCGAEYHGYTADVTRTIPIGGRFSADQRAIYEIVLEAQDSGIAACRSGNGFRAAHERAVSVVTRGLRRLGIIGDSAMEYRRYFMHGASHFLGMDVHDVGDYTLPLKAGVVMTVEPGIYIAPGSPCDKRWWGIGVRIEDDILVTNGEPVNLSGALERTVEDVERLMKGR